MPTVKQLIRNARQPIRNARKTAALKGCKAYGLVDIVGDEMIDDHCDTDPVWFPEMFKDW